MRSVDEVRRSVVEVIQHIYAKTQMYGPLAVELDSTLIALHWVLAEIDEAGTKLADVKAEVGGVPLHNAGSYARAFNIAHPNGGSEDERLAYVSSQWHEVSRRMGICE